MKSRRHLIAVATGVALLALIVAFVLLRHWPPHEKSAPAGVLRPAPLTIVVEAVYPGANARVVADTIAAPIEQQVNGVENMLHLRSHCADDGSYSLAVTFAPGADLSIAQVLVQNRIALAQPVLPELVNRSGVTVRKKSPTVRTLLVLFSPSNRYDEIYLSNYASIQLRDELVRLRGVGDVAMLGDRGYGLQVSLDPARLAARALTAADVIKVLEDQNLQPVAGMVGALDEKALAVTVNPNGRLQGPEDFGNIIVKTAPGGTVFLRDIARIELGANGEHRGVRIDGHPAVALAIHPLAPDVDAQALERALQSLVQQLRKNLPEGLALETAFNFAPDIAPAALLVDVRLPGGASSERVMSVLEQCDAVIRKIDGVTRTLVATDDPFAAPRARPCILVSIAPEKQATERARIATDLRQRLHNEVVAATVRVNDLAAPGRATPGGYPIAFAVSDVSDSGLDSLSKLAERLVQRLNESAQMTDIGASPSPTESPQMLIDIDRTKAAAFGVSMADIQKNLQTALGGVSVGRFQQFGRNWQMTVRAGEGRHDVETLLQIKVATANGQMVPLSALASIRTATGPRAVARLDLYPMLEISGNPAPGVTPAEARAFCEKIANEEMGPEFRMTWLSDMPK